MANPLSHLEDAAEQLIEGTFARMFGARLQPIEVARRIARAMEDGQVINAQGRIVVPNAYQVYLNPDDYAALEDYREAMQDELARYVANLARSADATMPGRPRVFVQANVGISLRRVRVEARLLSGRHGGAAPSHTQAMPSMQAPVDAEQPHFALFDGHRRMPIGEAVITIGRGLDNDIILDDRRVSRAHAQLRRRYGQYVLYDLDSTGGTTVNGDPVRETPLQPGDLIAFAGVRVRFEQLEALAPNDDPDGPRPTRPILRPTRKASP
ncbi:MAG: FHA domain-containing protein [Anaerolineae bacterium]|nr:FHA domain-containing protein [Anaerolineae bacterium]